MFHLVSKYYWLTLTTNINNNDKEKACNVAIVYPRGEDGRQVVGLLTVADLLAGKFSLPYCVHINGHGKKGCRSMVSL